MTHVAPRIVNNVSFVSRINHEIHFAWQAQYLVSLDNDTCCRMQLRAATKQTNFVRVIRQKFQSNARLGSGCHKPFYRHMFVLSYMYFTF